MQSVMREGSYAAKMLVREDDFLALLKMGESAGIELEIDGKLDPAEDTPYEVCIIKGILDQTITVKCEGMKVILCHDLIQPKHMYVFAMPKDIGVIYLGNALVAIEKRFNILQWEGCITGGMNVANIFNIAEIIVGQKQIKSDITKTKKPGFLKKLFRRNT